MKLFNLILGLLICGISFSQTQIDFNAGNNNTTVSTCNGFIIDSGGQGGSGYGNNENVTITICPDTIASGNNTDFINIIFNLFNLDTFDDNPAPNQSNLDVMNVYDGPSTASNTLGSYTGTGLANTTIQATNLNPSGCITLQFISNTQNNAGAWQFTASATCATPCAPPSSGAQINGGDALDSIRVCVGDLVDFQEVGSFAQSSFNLVSYEWNFMDGTTAVGSQGGTVQHAFTDPGHYVVNLYVTDDNQFTTCINSNLNELNVFVATPPTFYEFPNDTSLCVGESIDLVAQPEIFDSLWSGFPNSNYIDNGCMYDTQLGVAQVVPITLTGFQQPTITDPGQIQSICLDMEHSYMGDLVIQVQCPGGGAIVTLHQQGGGGTQIGIPNQADNVQCDPAANQGVPFTYCFTPTATETWVQWVNNNGFGQTLPAGDYAPVNPLSGLVGCPIGGTWNLIVTDNWGADDGTVFGWSIDLVDSLDPIVVNFQPNVGDNSDSSYWDATDPFITNITPNGNIATITPTVAGAYQYNYSVWDDYGCYYDSSLTITVDPPIIIDAGLDTSVCNGQLVTIGPQVAQCGTDAGNYTYCYGNSENTTFTYCPDNPGDGLTFMQIAFNSGSTESGWDDVTVYDGPDSNSPVIGLFEGSLAGMVFTATNASGCITMVLSTDGSVSCTSGSQTSWDYDVSCGGGGAALDFAWTPNDGSLDDVTIANPTVINPQTTTTYTLSVSPVGHPQCVTTDDVIVSIGGGLNAGGDSTVIFCFEGAPEDLYNYLGGSPQPGGQWFNPAGQGITMPIQPDTIANGLYEYLRDSAGCFVSAFIDVTVTQIGVSAVINNSDCNAFNGEVQLIPTNIMGSVQFSNDAGANYQTGDTFIGSMGSGNTYSFMIQDSVGCIATLDTIVIDDNFPQIDNAVTVDSDCGANNGQVDAATTASGGTAPYIYSVDGVTAFLPLGLTGLPPSDPNPYDLILEDANGCRDTIQITIAEINPPLITNVDMTDVTCYSVGDGTISINGNNLMSYSIDNGANFQSSNQFTNLTPGTYDIVATSGPNGTLCAVTSQVVIIEPTALQITVLSPDITVCPGDDVILTVEGIGGNGNYTFDWDFLGNNIGQGSTITVTADFAMQVCATMSEDCPSPTVAQCMNITTTPDISPSMIADVTEGCFPLEVTFTNTSNSSDIASSIWITSDDGIEQPVVGNAGITHVFQTPGIFDIQLSMESIYGCTYDTTYSQYIQAYDHPNANYTYSPIPLTIYETEAQFTDYTEGNPVLWSWNFGSGAIPLTSAEQNPMVVYPEGIAAVYPTMLYVWNEYGCVDSLASQVEVINDVNIYAPNVFTPDGDEFNETWRVYINGIDIYDYHCIIFNRWGETIWESYNPEAEWEGTYAGGDEVQDGTYVWLVYAKDSYNDKKYEFRGTVNIIR